MEWITDGSKPEVEDSFKSDYELYSSKRVVVLLEDGTIKVASWCGGDDLTTGAEWEGWSISGHDGLLKNVTAWCDCIPKINKTINF